MRLSRTAFALGLAMLAYPLRAEENPVAEAIIEYMDYATPTAGIILPVQIDRSVYESAVFFDMREPEQYAEGHLPGAANIPWREVPRRLDEVPESGLVVFYCDTGARSSQATFAARLMGRENVVVMQSGLTGWLETAAWKP